MVEWRARTWATLGWTPAAAFPDGFGLTLRPHKLGEPYRLRRPTLIFVNSMSDLFWEAVPEAYRDRVVGMIEDTPRHEYQVLTNPGAAGAGRSRQRPVTDRVSVFRVGSFSQAALAQKASPGPFALLSKARGGQTPSAPPSPPRRPPPFRRCPTTAFPPASAGPDPIRPPPAR